jgi:hypothetical protein
LSLKNKQKVLDESIEWFRTSNPKAIELKDDDIDTIRQLPIMEMKYTRLMPHLKKQTIQDNMDWL